jgi:NAD(P)-dependent dehydrogenase (short-subunit alcohol dehydrogenase family)
MATQAPDKSLLLIGASRGLGYAMAEEYLKLGWTVVATARKESSPLVVGLAFLLRAGMPFQ